MLHYVLHTALLKGFIIILDANWLILQYRNRYNTNNSWEPMRPTTSGTLFLLYYNSSLNTSTRAHTFTHIMKVLRVRVIVLRGVVGQRGVMCVRMPRRVEASWSVQQSQTVGHLVVEMMAGLGHHGSGVSTARVYASIHMAGARQRGIFQNIAVHLCRLVQVTRRVVFYRE